MSIDDLFRNKPSGDLVALRTALQNNHPVIVFGAGNLGKKIADFLLNNKFNLPLIADNNQAKWGAALLGKPIVSATQALELYKEAVWIVSIWSPGHSFASTKKQLQSIGVKNIFHAAALMQLFPAELLPHYHFQTPDFFLAHEQEIKEVYYSLADEESKKQYLAHINCRINLDFESLPQADLHNQYFPGDFIELSDQETFLDAGAYTGDTLTDFVERVKGQFNKYIALEPDPANNKALSATAKKYPGTKIEIFPFAVGNENCLLNFDATGGGGAGLSSEGTLEVECKRIDDVFPNEPFTYLKFDIEGAELDALKGAFQTIEKNHPRLAVCIYHLPDDLWQIPLFIKNNFPFYKLHTRTHQYDGLDFVLYAICH
jgi:FkbM family methyltransferase